MQAAVFHNERGFSTRSCHLAFGEILAADVCHTNLILLSGSTYFDASLTNILCNHYPHQTKVSITFQVM
jgi:hypothetical protein